MEEITIASLNPEECQEIKNLTYRRGALIELSKFLESKEKIPFYEKVITDLWRTEERNKNWWLEIGKKYGFNPSFRLSIDFNTGDIKLVLTDSAHEINRF